MSSHSFYHPQEVLLDQFSLYMHTDGLKPHTFIYTHRTRLGNPILQGQCVHPHHEQLGTHHLTSGRGGGLSFFVFFYLRWKTSFFWRSTSDNFFFYVSLKFFFVICFPYYVRYHFVFSLVNIFFINFDNKLFFLPTFSTNFFFLLLWRQTIFSILI